MTVHKAILLLAALPFLSTVDFTLARAATNLDPSTPTPASVIGAPEFCPSDALILYWTGHHDRVLLDLCRAVAGEARVICCVANAKIRERSEKAMAAAGVDLTHVEFLETRHASAWIRDYGPYSTYRDGALVVTDMRTPGRADPIPTFIAELSGLPSQESLLVHAGGNHIADGNGMAFCSEHLFAANPSWTAPSIRREMSAALGIDSLVVLPTLEGDTTGHCDMYVKLLSDTLFAVGEYERPEDGAGTDAKILDEIAERLSSMQNLDGRRFGVVRLPMNPIVPGSLTSNRSYTNSLIFNDKVLVPVYGTDLDEKALRTYAASMPGYQIIPIDASESIESAGAVHCLSNQLHSANPLLVLHEPTRNAAPGDQLVLECRLVPRFADCEVELHLVARDGDEMKPVPAVLSRGVWRAKLPPVRESFDYWFEARAHTDAGVLRATLPRGASSETFSCEVDGSADDEESVARDRAER